MWQQIQYMLKPPHFADEEKTYRATLIYVTASVLILMLIFNLYFLYTQTNNQARDAITATGLMITFICCLWWAKQGHVQRAGLVLTIVIWGATTSFLLTYGLRDPVAGGYYVAIVVATLLLGKAGTVLGLVLSLGTIGILSYGEVAGLLPPSATPTLISIFRVNLVILVAIGALVYKVTHVVNGALAQARATQQALLASEKRLEHILASAPISMVLSKPRGGQLIQVNEATCQMLGYTKTELLSRGFNDITHKDDIASSKKVVQAMLAGEMEKAQFEKRYYHRDGHTICAITTVYLMRDEQGEPDYLISQIQDITQRKQMEEALRQSEANLQEAQQIAQLGNFEFDLQAQSVRWSDEAYRIFGIEVGEEISLERYQKLLAPEDFQRVMTAVSHTITSQQPYVLEHDIILDNGRRKHLYCAGRPFHDEAGQVVRIFGIVQDITQTKLVEKSLQENMARYRTLFESAHDAIWLYTLDGKVITANPQACELSGYSLEEMVGTTTEYLRPAQDWEAANQKFQQAALAGGDPPVYERALVRKNGEQRLTEIRIRRVEDHDGSPLFLFGVVRDITERKQAEAQIKASLREKEILLKEIHHRVKNNLQVISSLLDLQSDYITDAPVKEMFQESRSRVRSMALVHEQLYQSVNLAQINFAEYVQNLTGYLLQVYGHLARQVHLQMDIARLPLSIETAVPLSLIINELVSNAYKHAFVDGRSGTITLALTTSHHHHLELSVQDNGIGIPAHIDIHQHPSLGLTIVNTLTEQLGGQLELQRPSGTRFVLTFP
ncbi:MAG: PAS domain S-box protein, partial [Ardenticatenaceae bacterium]|nr:PAS domain S-box protein [Ardenticatenaceae bacterium]